MMTELMFLFFVCVFVSETEIPQSNADDSTSVSTLTSGKSPNSLLSGVLKVPLPL